MKLDDLQRVWATHGTQLERSLAINERLLREMLLRKMRLALTPFVLGRALEVAVGLAALVATASVLVSHPSEPLYLLVGGAVAVIFAGVTALCAQALVRALQLDYTEPVLELQRRLERLRLAEYRAFKWALLGGIVAWLPAPLILFEAFTGVDALARVDLAWLVGNVVFGLLVLVAGHVWARCHLEPHDLGPRARRLVDALTGRAVRAARRRLAELASFEREV